MKTALRGVLTLGVVVMAAGAAFAQNHPASVTAPDRVVPNIA